MPPVTKRILRGREVTLTTPVPPDICLIRVAELLQDARPEGSDGVPVGSVLPRGFIVQLRSTRRSLISRCPAAYGTVTRDGSRSAVHLHLAVPPVALVPYLGLIVGGIGAWFIVIWTVDLREGA